MLDQGTTMRCQRAAGCAEGAVWRRSGRSRRERLFQSGAAKAVLRHVHRPEPEITSLTPAGGLTVGDEPAYWIDVGAGVLATTRAAQREHDCTAAMVARAQLERGVKQNRSEAVALITDHVVEDGRSVVEPIDAGVHVVRAEQCMEGCRR